MQVSRDVTYKFHIVTHLDMEVKVSEPSEYNMWNSPPEEVKLPTSLESFIYVMKRWFGLQSSLQLSPLLNVYLYFKIF